MQNKNFEIDNSGIDPQTNFSDNPDFQSVLASRRSFLKGSLGAAIATIMGTSLVACSSDTAEPATGPVAIKPEPAPVLLGFTAIAANRLDTVTVPAGYTARPFLPMGTPLLGSYPAYLADGSNSGADMEQQVGAHHDGMHFFPLDARSSNKNSDEGLLVFNHEYLDANVLHPMGPDRFTTPSR